MCLIIYCPPHHRPSLKRLLEAHKANSDNFGWLVYSDLGFGYHKGEFASLLYLPKTGKVALHFRTASSGGKSEDQAHPLQITNDLYFMANGNLSHFQGDRKRSDMQVFRDEVLKPAFAGLSDKVERITGSQTGADRSQQPPGGMATASLSPFFDWLENYCRDNFTKMLFMDSTGCVRIINESQGVWDYSEDGGGCWFSNGGIENYIGYGFSGLYEYGENQVRHKRGLVTARFGAGWAQCDFCKGWFKPGVWRKPCNPSEPRAKSEPYTCPECELLNANPGNTEMRSLWKSRRL